MLAALSFTAVGSFRAVGAILVVAMLIAPAATAYLLTRRLPWMFVWSALAGVLSSVLGYHLSYWLDVSAAGTMVPWRTLTSDAPWMSSGAASQPLARLRS